jgi:serine beta-lactamase-like protein LACTB
LVIGHSVGQTECTSQIMIVLSTKTVAVVLSNTSGNYPEIATFTLNFIGLSESKINNPNDEKSSKK